MVDKLICKGRNDICRIYETNGSIWKYELRFNLIWDGDPCFGYDTLKGAKIAMARMLNGRYKNVKAPSTAW